MNKTSKSYTWKCSSILQKNKTNESEKQIKRVSDDRYPIEIYSLQQYYNTLDYKEIGGDYVLTIPVVSHS